MSIPALDLLNLHLDALYLQDSSGDIYAINQWDGGVVPLFHYSWCEAGYASRFRNDIPKSARRELLRNFDNEDYSSDCFKEPSHAKNCQRLISEHFKIQNLWHGLVYYRTTSVELGSQRTRLLAPGDEALLCDDLEPWRPDLEHRSPFVVAHNTEHAISVSASVRITTQAHEAGVETMHAYRRGGYADAAVRRWTNEVLKVGAIPMYSTSRDNIASQRLANRVGYTLVGYDFVVR